MHALEHCYSDGSTLARLRGGGKPSNRPFPDERARPIATPKSTAHAGIEPADIVDAALAIVEDGGPASLTMRKLAADLGVAATSIYWHIGQRDEVVAAVLARHASQLRDLPVEGKTGHDRVFSAAKNVWSSSLRHSNLSRLAHQAGSSDQAQPLLDALLGELAATGMDPEDAARLLRVLVNTVAGFLVQALRTDGAVAPGFDTRGWGNADGGGLDQAYLDAAGRPVELEPVLDEALHRLIPDG